MNRSSHFPVKRSVTAGDKDLPPPLQARSRATAGKFVSAALEVLRERTFAELSVAELARKADRSVGVFYQRFGSKDDFLAVLLSAFFDEVLEWRSRMPVDGKPADIYSRFLSKSFCHLLENRNLWHAALERSAADPHFWDAYGVFREDAARYISIAIETSLGRGLDGDEHRRLALAGQVFNSVINNQIINGPGPLILEDGDFFPELNTIVLNIALLPED